MNALTTLPIRRVRLYQHGLGYFEHQGRIEADGKIVLKIQNAALDDLLRTLSVVDLDGGHISALHYPAAGSQNQLLEWNGLNIDNKAPWQGLPQALVGQSIEIFSPGYSGQGKIIGVQNEKRENETLSLLTLQTTAGIRRLDLGQVSSLLPLKNETIEQLGQWLDLQSEFDNTNLSQIQIDTQGEGSRRLSLAYSHPHPAWRMSYRLFLQTGEKSFLQGWAVIDNPSPHAWNDVELSLISGQPGRSTLRLHKPPATFSPATFDSADLTEHSILKEHSSVSNSVVPSRGTFDCGGIDSILDSIFNEPVYVAQTVAAAQRVEVSIATAEKQDIHIEYAIDKPVSLSAGQGALIPVLRRELPARRVIQIRTNCPGEGAQAALELENDCELVFDIGPVVVLEQGHYLGEADLNVLTPGEKQLLAYGDERRVEVKKNFQHQILKSLSLVKVSARKLTLIWQERRITRVEVTSRLSEPADLILVHPCQWDQTLESLDGLQVSRTGSHLHIKDQISAGETRIYNIVIVQTLSQSQDVDSFNNEQFKQLTPEQQQILREILSGIWQRQSKVRALEKVCKLTEFELNEFYKRQQRLNTNLKAVEQQSDATTLRQAYLEPLIELDQQTRLLGQELEKQQQELKLSKLALETFLDQVDVEQSFTEP